MIGQQRLWPPTGPADSLCAGASLEPPATNDNEGRASTTKPPSNLVNRGLPVSRCGRAISSNPPATSRVLRRLAWTSAAGEGQVSGDRSMFGHGGIQSDWCSSLFRRDQEIQSWCIHGRSRLLRRFLASPLSLCVSVFSLIPLCCLFSSLRLCAWLLQISLVVSLSRLHSSITSLISVLLGLDRRLARIVSVGSSTAFTLAS